MLRRLAGDRVTVEVRRGGRARVRVDPGQLEQVLFNLVINSRDAMADGGHIVVEAGERVRRDGVESVVLRVTDDGEGMDPSTLAQCQKPFFTTKGRSRGTGLGLATVGSILERSGGTLEIASEPGRGTTVTAFFPEAADRGGPDLLPAQASRARVLLVDDDDQVRRFVQGVLTEAGYDVVATSDAESAIDHAEAGGFALLITDVV